MIDTLRNRTAAPSRASLLTLRSVAFVQGIFYVITGLWPILSVDTFQVITGPKSDLWLVYTVGVLVAAIGTALIIAAVRRNLTVEIAIVAIGAAIGLSGIDLVFVLRGTISGIYLLDAVVELAFIAGWVLSWLRVPDQVHLPSYPHVHALLARGQSVQLPVSASKGESG